MKRAENIMRAVFICIAIGATTPVAGNTIHVDSPVRAWPRDALVELHTTALSGVAGSAHANRIHRQLATANAAIDQKMSNAILISTKVLARLHKLDEHILIKYLTRLTDSVKYRLYGGFL